MSRFSREIPFRVESSLSHDEAARRLREANLRKTGMFSLRTRPLLQVEGNQFYAHRDSGRNIVAEIRATLRPEEGGMVLSGTASISRFTFYFPVLLLSAMLLFQVFLKTDGAFDSMEKALFFGLPIVGVFHLAAFRNRSFLIRYCRDALDR